MLELVLKLDCRHSDALGGVRNIHGLKVALDGTCLWIRGILHTEEPDIRIRQLPVLHSYIANEKELLFIPGHATPFDKLPLLNWKPVTDFLPVELPVSSLPGNVPAPVPFHLVASPEERRGYALLTSLNHWKQYAEKVSAIRLQPLRFAVSDKAEVLIIGSPLPALPGKEYWISEDLLIPSGFEPEAPVSLHLLAESFNKNRDHYLMLAVDGNWQSIPKHFLVSATRSGIRLSGNTIKELSHG